ncbi:unnamed protein product [Ectocarpus sp. 4 AP-2014]
MEVLAMMEGKEYQQKFCRPRFRSYQPVICELLRRGEMDGVMQLWKHMEWHSIRPKESFLLDLIEGIANNNHASSRDSLTQLADHLLDGMSKTLIYPSAPTVKALVEGWNAKWTDVSEQGTCTTCGEMLQGTRLTPEDRARMRSSIVHIAAQNGAREVQRLSWFANWFCSLEDPPTAIIDGPNVGFMNQNFKEGGFSFTQVDWLAEHLKSKGERVLITMPWYYCKDDNFPMRADRRESRGGKARKFSPKRSWTPVETEIVQKWVDNQWLVMVEGLDDLYWMYATVARDDVNTLVLTNDLMRDHRNFFPGTREFVRWKRSHLVSFSFRWEKDGPQAWVQGKQAKESRTPPAINLSPGASWKEVQRTGSNWHLPVRVRRNSRKHNCDNNSNGDDGLRDHAEPIKSCLCIPMPTSMTRASNPSPSSSSTYSRTKKSSLLPTGDGGIEQREEEGDRYRRTINTA